VTLLRDCNLWGGFFDTALAYNFGPPSHDATIATLRAEVGDAPVAEAFLFPLGRSGAAGAIGLAAHVERDT
jgi:beta-mannosidase